MGVGRDPSSATCAILGKKPILSGNWCCSSELSDIRNKRFLPTPSKPEIHIFSSSGVIVVLF